MPPTFWGLEIGSWTQLVSGILTAGSLALGFSILRRDRRKEESAQALKISAWTTYQYDGIHEEPSAVVFKVINSSDQPIIFLVAQLRLQKHKMRTIPSHGMRVADKGTSKRYLRQYSLSSLGDPTETTTTDSPHPLGPHEERDLTVKFDDAFSNDFYKSHLIFTDASGIEWTRTLDEPDASWGGTGVLAVLRKLTRWRRSRALKAVATTKVFDYLIFFAGRGAGTRSGRKRPKS